MVEPLQVIAAPRRLRILELVWDRELPAGQIAAQFDVSFSAISQHLHVLKAAGFLIERRRGELPVLAPIRWHSARSARSSRTIGGLAWTG